MEYIPSWMERREIESAATDLAAALWVKFFEPEESLDTTVQS